MLGQAALRRLLRIDCGDLVLEVRIGVDDVPALGHDVLLLSGPRPRIEADGPASGTKSTTRKKSAADDDEHEHHDRRDHRLPARRPGHLARLGRGPAAGTRTDSSSPSCRSAVADPALGESLRSPRCNTKPRVRRMPHPPARRSLRAKLAPIAMIAPLSWQGQEGSNLRPTVLETVALPAELHSYATPCARRLHNRAGVPQGRRIRAILRPAFDDSPPCRRPALR